MSPVYSVNHLSGLYLKCQLCSRSLGGSGGNAGEQAAGRSRDEREPMYFGERSAFEGKLVLGWSVERRIGESLGPGAFDSQRAHSGRQRIGIQTEKLSGAAGTRDFPARVFQSGEDIVALELNQILGAHDFRRGRFGLGGVISEPRHRIREIGVSQSEVEPQARTPGEYHGTLDHVLEFTDIAGPIVARQHPDIFVGLAYLGPFQTAAGKQGEMRRERRYIFLPLPQRRELHGKNAEPVIEVLTKAAVGDLLTEVTIGSGHETDVNLTRGVLADPFEVSFLGTRSSFA
jgi:hypothetical protein